MTIKNDLKEKGQKNKEEKEKENIRKKNHTTTINLIFKSNIGAKKLDSKVYYK